MPPKKKPTPAPVVVAEPEPRNESMEDGDDSTIGDIEMESDATKSGLSQSEDDGSEGSQSGDESNESMNVVANTPDSMALFSETTTTTVTTTKAAASPKIASKSAGAHAAKVKVESSKRKPAPIDNTSSKDKVKRRRKRKETYSLYIYKILRQTDGFGDIGISSSGMSIMNSMVNDLFERLAHEAANITKMNKTRTITAREIITAARLIIPGQLGVHAVGEANKALLNYQKSHEKH